ncbi:MAG: PRC-barrel domain-containing protein [Candidatus Hodarchaeaceae archaeon]|nr:PRC-barrel domain-containing protein [Candidatus Hodarchaeaceae archaeon]
MISKLRAIGVISDRGTQVGRLGDLLFDEKDGKILSLVVRPISKDVLAGVPRDSSGNALIPFNAVMSIRDFIVVNERVLAVHQLKAQPRGAGEFGALPSKE